MMTLRGGWGKAGMAASRNNAVKKDSFRFLIWTSRFGSQADGGAAGKAARYCPPGVHCHSFSAYEPATGFLRMGAIIPRDRD